MTFVSLSLSLFLFSLSLSLVSLFVSHTFSLSSFLTVAPKIIDTTPGTYTRNTTNNMAFNCTAGGYPRPTIEWTKDDQTLTNSVKVAITSRYLDQRPDDMLLVTSTLTLSDLNHEADSGNYKCRASNLVVPRVAVLQSPFILNVSGKLIMAIIINVDFFLLSVIVLPLHFLFFYLFMIN